MLLVVTMSILALLICFNKFKQLNEKLRVSNNLMDMYYKQASTQLEKNEMINLLPSVIYEGDNEYVLCIDKNYNTNLWEVKYICKGKIVIKEENRGVNNVVEKVWKRLLELGLTEMDWSRPNE